MSEKILSEFAVRLNKSRTQLQDVCNQVEGLRKESNRLQGDLDTANEERVAAEKEQENLRNQYDTVKHMNEMENAKYQREQAELRELRKKKLEMTKGKELQEKECEKLSNELSQHIADRKELEHLAKKLSEQLESVQGERQQLQSEYMDN